MKKKLEVELKFAVLDPEQVKVFLDRKKFIVVQRIRDVYLDTDQADLFKRGIFIRIRNDKKLDFKFNAKEFGKHGQYNLHDHHDEFSFRLPLTKKSVGQIEKICRILLLKPIVQPSVDVLKKTNNLIDSIVVDKKRRIYRDELFEYSFDEVKGLGIYLEIENLNPSVESVAEMKEQMLIKLKGLKIKHLNVGYNELYWRKHNFEVYKQGLYLLKEDYQA